MVDTLIVDGYNIIHAIPELENELNESLMSARRALSEALSRYQAGERSIKKIYVAYDSKDGTGDIEDMGLVKNIYAPKNSNADKEIVSMLKAAKNPKRIAVLSRDNFVINHARAMGVDILSLNKFLKKITTAKKENSRHRLSDEDKDEITRELKNIWNIK